MFGILRLMIALSLIIAAVYGVIWLWTGVLPAHGLKVLATIGVMTVLSLAIMVLSKPVGGQKN